MRQFLPAIAAGFAVAMLANPAAAQDPENTLVMELKCGDVHIALRPDVAPNHA